VTSAAPSAPVRATRAVIDDHLRRRLAGDVDGDIATNYDSDVVLLTGIGVLRGFDGVRRSAEVLARDLPDATFEILTVLDHGDVAFVEWRATSKHARCEDGADGFVVTDGRIRAQTIHYTLIHRTGVPEPNAGHGDAGNGS
jgi:hypothetical protein